MTAPAPAPDYRSPDYRRPAGVRWGLGAAATAIGWFALVPLLSPALALIGVHLAGWAALGVSVGAYLAAAAFAAAVARVRGLGSAAADFGLVFRPVDLAIGLGAAVVLEIVRALLGAAVLPLFRTAPTSNVHLTSDPALNGATAVLAVVLAPIVEELITRGLLLRAVRNAVLRGQPSAVRRRAAVGTSIVVSAVVFTALHLHEAPDAVTAVVLIVTTLPIGLTNAWFATRLGRLGPGIVTHGLLNAFALVLALTTR